MSVMIRINPGGEGGGSGMQVIKNVTNKCR